MIGTRTAAARVGLTTAAAVAALVLACAAPCAAAAEKAAEAPTYRVGDWWLLRMPGDSRNRAFRAKIVRIEGSTITMVQGPRQEEAVYDLQLNRLQAYEEPSGRLVTYRPRLYGLDFPLVPGKTWGGEVAWAAGPYNGTLRVEAQAEGWEEVPLQIGAGPRRGEVEKLDTLRLRYQHDDSGRIIKSTCWYAPKIRFPVRCESTDPSRAHEVVDYGTTGDPAAKAAPAAAATP